VSFYAGQYAPDANRVLRCQVDGTFLRASSEDVYEIVHRYDAVEFWLSPAVQDSTALAQLRLSTVDNSQDAVSVQTKAGIAVVIRRARKQLALRGVTAGVGAAFVALPAVVDQSTSIGLRVLSASIGVLLIALVAIFTGPPK
jgi:hypothetical protein